MCLIIFFALNHTHTSAEIDWMAAQPKNIPPAATDSENFFKCKGELSSLFTGLPLFAFIFKAPNDLWTGVQCKHCPFVILHNLLDL